MDKKQIKFTPEVVKWAREFLSIPRAEVAKRIGLEEKDIKNIEEGRVFLNKKQAQQLADLYHRPFLFFYLSTPPEGEDSPTFFRTKKQKYGTCEILLLEELRDKQNWIREVYIEERRAKCDFIARFTVTSKPEEIAEDISQTLSINKEIIGKSIGKLVQHIERYGIFVCRGRTLANNSRATIDDKVQGIAMADPYAPFLFIHTGSSEVVQRFTLFHELAHLWIGQDVLLDTDPQDLDSFSPIEALCNEVAAQILMPSDDILAETDITNYTKLAKKYKVSTWAYIYRLFRLKKIDSATYSVLKKEINDEFSRSLEEKVEPKVKKSGGGNYYNSFIPKNSASFIKELYAHYQNYSVSATTCMHLLRKKNIKQWSFSKIIQNIQRDT